MRAAVDLAARCDLTVYDAAYMALTKELEAQVITADRTLHTAVASL